MYAVLAGCSKENKSLNEDISGREALEQEMYDAVSEEFEQETYEAENELSDKADSGEEFFENTMSDEGNSDEKSWGSEMNDETNHGNEPLESEMEDAEMSEEPLESEMHDEIDSADRESEEEYVQYIAEEYGEIQPYGSEFYFNEETKGFYYNLEMFFLGSDFLYTMNDTLQEFYDGYLKQYQEEENRYMEQGEPDFPEGVVPYSELIFLGIQHIENDYVSLLFNDVTYMGGVHPYSRFDAITVDRCTGKEVTASEILEESDEEILEKVSDLMGLDTQADWTDIDFFLQEDTIVFFYRMPGYWEDVILRR